MPESDNKIVELATEPEDLKPKKPSNRAPEGIRTFTVCRRADETGISGEGVVIEGATFATGHTIIHWLSPAPRGSIAFFDAFDDFVKIHVTSHPKMVRLSRLKMVNRLFTTGRRTMSYKWTSGSVRRGDIYFEDDRTGAATYIDFGQDTITLRPSGSAMLYVEDGAVGIGTTTPDNLLTVVGGHISSDGGVKSGEVHFTWSKHSNQFAHNTADLVTYLSFGDNIVWGWIEVTLTDDHWHARATGKYTKRYQIGRNAGGNVIHQSSEVPACLGAIADEFKLGNYETGSVDSDLRIPIYNISDRGNKVCVFVEGQIFISSVIDGVDLILNSLSLSTPAVVSNSETRDYYSIMADRVGIGTNTPGSTLQVVGSLQFKVSQLSGDTTLDDTHHVISADCNAASVVVTLPTVSESIAGRVYIIKRADTGDNGDGNSLTIARNGANIDGAGSNLSSIENGTSHTLICVGGAGWIIVDKYVGI